MREVAVVSAVRTPVGTFSGSFTNTPAVDLGALVVAEAVKRAGITNEDVDEVILGNVLQAGLGQNPARQAAVKAGLPIEVPAWTVNMVCGSGLRTVALGAQAIANGDADTIVTGGMENMSQAPYVLTKARSGYRMGNQSAIDEMIYDGLWCAFNDYHMGITAENIAQKFGISREEQDVFALRSQQKAAAAIQAGKFKSEILPVEVSQGKGKKVIFDTDEHVRANTTQEGLAKLKPAFKADGTVTAGNASGINDGAAAVVLMSVEKAQAMNLKPMAVIRSYASAGVDPKIMGMGPVPSSEKALRLAGLSVSDLGRIEANEAFAAQSIAVARELDLPPERTNVNGGAIAIGHPIGASGARIFVTLLHELKESNEKFGLATLCIGGGQGVAMVLENIRS